MPVRTSVGRSLLSVQAAFPFMKFLPDSDTQWKAVFECKVFTLCLYKPKLSTGDGIKKIKGGTESCSVALVVFLIFQRMFGRYFSKFKCTFLE